MRAMRAADRSSVTPYDAPLAPPRWARGGQAQTLLGYCLSAGGTPLRPGERGATRREVELDDGDRLVVVDGPPLCDGPLAGVTVHLFHGLSGSTDSNYIGLVSSELRGAGAFVVGMNHRGQGLGAGLARGLYHSGSDADLWASVAAARVARPGDVHVGVGFSLSANTLLLGAARREDIGPDALLAVNPPVDLLASVRRLERGLNRLYDRHFVRGMRRSLEERRARGYVGADVVIPHGASVREADDAVTAPAAGYGSADEYYADCSSGPRLRRVRRPAVLLTSADDPFLSPDDLPREGERGSVHVHVERAGGHLGYLARGPRSQRRWLRGAVRHYVEELVGRVRS